MFQLNVLALVLISSDEDDVEEEVMEVSAPVEVDTEISLEKEGTVSSEMKAAVKDALSAVRNMCLYGPISARGREFDPGKWLNLQVIVLCQ